jgi:hypothetical protein
MFFSHLLGVSASLYGDISTILGEYFLMVVNSHQFFIWEIVATGLALPHRYLQVILTELHAARLIVRPRSAEPFQTP